MSLAIPGQVAQGEAVVVELKIDLNKIMRFRAFLPAHPGVKLDVTMENPLATRNLTPEQKAALEKRWHLAEKRQADPLFQPSAGEWIELAHLERQADEPERALEILQRLEVRLKQRGETIPAEGHNIFGLCYGRLGRRDLSHEHYRRASEMDPARANYAANCGFALIHLGRPEEAVDFLRRAVAADPADGHAYVILGDALRHAGREAEAQGIFQEGKRRLELQLQQSPNSTYLLSWAESVCHRLGEDEPMKLFKQRREEAARNARLGASPDEFVAARAVA
jgi:tetratricopeptide (TPR) repeat protein